MRAKPSSAVTPGRSRSKPSPIPKAYATNPALGDLRHHHLVADDAPRHVLRFRRRQLLGTAILLLCAVKARAGSASKALRRSTSGINRMPGGECAGSRTATDTRRQSRTGRSSAPISTNGTRQHADVRRLQIDRAIDGQRTIRVGEIPRLHHHRRIGRVIKRFGARQQARFQHDEREQIAELEGAVDRLERAAGAGSRIGIHS